MKQLLGVLIGLFIVAGNANSALVTTTFDYYDNQSVSYLNLLQHYTFSATYDDQGSVGHTYNDGQNYIGEFGSGDDSILYTRTRDWCFGCAFISDANLNISNLLLSPISNSDMIAISMTNESWVYNYSQNYFSLYYQKDGHSLYVLVNNAFCRPSAGGKTECAMWIDYWHYGMTSSSGSTNLTSSGWVTMSTTVSTVPAPPAFILMLTGLGLIGLTKRFRKTV